MSLCSEPRSDIKTLREEFRRAGACVVRGLLRESCIQSLSGALSDKPPPDDNRADRFSRHDYQHADRIQPVVELSRDPVFRRVMSEVTGRTLFMTEAITFGVKAGQSGFPWHFDGNTFNFIRPKDFGCSMWVPLCPIRKNEQRGGLAYGPQDKLSAQDMYVFLASILEIGDHQRMFDILHKRFPDEALPYICIGDLEREILDRHAIEPDLELGDVILFRKDSYHRSCEFLAGPIAERTTYTFRFIDSECRYMPEFFTEQAKAWALAGFHVTAVTSYGKSLSDLESGELVRNSINFRGLPVSAG